MAARARPGIVPESATTAFLVTRDVTKLPAYSMSDLPSQEGPLPFASIGVAEQQQQQERQFGRGIVGQSPDVVVSR